MYFSSNDLFINLKLLCLFSTRPSQCLQINQVPNEYNALLPRTSGKYST